MALINHSQVQELVRQLPNNKLPRAFQLLQDLASSANSGSDQVNFMQLPLEERRRLLAEQAREIKAEYETNAAERQSWQAGDFHDGY
jgi:hypothetical protein